MDHWVIPTAEQQDQATIAHHEIVEAFNRLILEGMDRRIVMAGAGAAICDLITVTFGVTAVEPWFQKQAEIVASAVAARH